MSSTNATIRGLQEELRTLLALHKAYAAIAASTAQVRRTGHNTVGTRAGVLFHNSAQHLGALKAHIAETRRKLRRLQNLKGQRRRLGRV